MFSFLETFICFLISILQSYNVSVSLILLYDWVLNDELDNLVFCCVIYGLTTVFKWELYTISCLFLLGNNFCLFLDFDLTLDFSGLVRRLAFIK